MEIFHNDLLRERERKKNWRIERKRTFLLGNIDLVINENAAVCM